MTSETARAELQRLFALALAKRLISEAKGEAVLLQASPTRERLRSIDRKLQLALDKLSEEGLWLDVESATTEVQ